MSKKYVRWRNMHLPKLERIQLSTKHVGIRALAVGILLLIAALSLVSGMNGLLNQNPGWDTIQSEAEGVHLGGEFQLSYDFSDYGGAATAAYKELTQLYSQGTADAYRIFETEVASLSEQVNMPVSVDPVLYEAFALLEQYGSRSIYLAPIYVEYNQMFGCEDPVQAAALDPTQNPELQPYIQELASFANDPDMIRLELLGDDQVRLYVDQAYLDFAEQNEIGQLLDFGWMRNAFVVDYLADLMVEAGYTAGYLASYDGFTRNLDTRGLEYNFNLFHRQGQTINMPAVFQYDTPLSIVFLRDYPMDTSDKWHYFDFGGGSITSVYVDPADGMSKCHYENLVSYGENTGCAEILLEMIPSFVTDVYDPSLFEAQDEGIYTIWFEGSGLCHNESGASIQLTDSGVEGGYTLEQAN